MSIKKYKIITVPAYLNLPFEDMDKKLAKEYYNWVLSIKEERINYLKSFLKNQGLIFTNSEKYLKELYDWFEKNIKFRELTEEELKEYEKFRDVKIETTTFTSETVSLIFDVSLLWANCLISKNKNIIWYFENRKSYVNYAQPVLMGTSNELDVNPRNIIEVVAYKIKENKDLNDEFNKLLNMWIDLLDE